MSPQGFADRAGGRDWKQLLMDAGGKDLLHGTIVQEIAEDQKRLPSWLIEIDNFFSPVEFQQFSSKSRSVLSVAQSYGTPNTEKTQDNGVTSYSVMNMI